MRRFTDKLLTLALAAVIAMGAWALKEIYRMNGTVERLAGQVDEIRQRLPPVRK